MLAAITGFNPPFSPSDANINPNRFEAFLNDLDTLNLDVSVLLGEYSALVEERVATVKEIKDRALRIANYLESAGKWKTQLPRITALKNKIRGNVPRKPRPPADSEDDSSATAKTRNQGEQSYAEIQSNFDALIAALKKVTGYTAPADELRIDLPEGEAIPAEIEAIEDEAAKRAAKSALSQQLLAEQMTFLNKTLKTKETDLKSKQVARRDGYDGESGLKGEDEDDQEGLQRAVWYEVSGVSGGAGDSVVIQIQV